MFRWTVRKTVETVTDELTVGEGHTIQLHYVATDKTYTVSCISSKEMIFPTPILSYDDRTVAIGGKITYKWFCYDKETMYNVVNRLMREIDGMNENTKEK